MAALWIGHYIFALWFLLSSFFFFISSPNLSRRRLDVYHITTHGVALVRIYNAGMKCASCSLPDMQDPKKSPKIHHGGGHHRTTLSGYIFATKARIDSRKKNLLNRNISPTRPHNMVNFGLLADEIASLV